MLWPWSQFQDSKQPLGSLHRLRREAWPGRCPGQRLQSTGGVRRNYPRVTIFAVVTVGIFMGRVGLPKSLSTSESITITVETSFGSRGIYQGHNAGSHSWHHV